jgi:hypothetical protein
LLAAKLPIRRPERLKFFRGLCQVAKVMPDHAREVLTALTATGLRHSVETPDSSMAAKDGERLEGDGKMRAKRPGDKTPGGGRGPHEAEKLLEPKPEAKPAIAPPQPAEPAATKGDAILGAITAWIIAAPSGDWKMFRPMSTPTAPAWMAL